MAIAARQRAGRGDRRLQIVDALRLVELAQVVHGLVPLGLGLVGDVDAGLDAPEQIRADGDEAEIGDLGGDGAHGIVDAEDFLDQHHGAGRDWSLAPRASAAKLPDPSVACTVIVAIR